MPSWLMGLWDFLKDPDNRTVIAWLCGGIVAVAGGAWTVFTFFADHKKADDERGGGANLTPSAQGAASGRDIVIERTVIERLVRWGIFGVLVSLAPLFFSYGNLLLNAQAATVAKVVGNGELLVIVWAMCAGALGELLGGTQKYRVPKLFSAGFTLLVLIFSTLLFASVAENKVAGTRLDEVTLVLTSFYLLGCGLISCACCIALSDT